jgi:hypothetical protein
MGRTTIPFCMAGPTKSLVDCHGKIETSHQLRELREHVPLVLTGVISVIRGWSRFHWYRPLARIIHKLSAATPGTLADTALHSVGRLDLWSYTPAAASVTRLVSAAFPPVRDDNS